MWEFLSHGNADIAYLLDRFGLLSVSQRTSMEDNDLSYTYFFDAYGNMTSGKWFQIGGKWYYFNADGSLARSTTIDGYEVDENGVRKTK